MVQIWNVVISVKQTVGEKCTKNLIEVISLFMQILTLTDSRFQSW